MRKGFTVLLALAFLQLHTKLLGTPVSREMPKSASDEIDELRKDAAAGSLGDRSDVHRLQRPINSKSDHDEDDDDAPPSPGPDEHI